MNRENVNRIKFILDNVLPPFVRDSFFYDWLLKIYFKANFKLVSQFRKRAKSLSFEEYVSHYQDLPDIMGETDLNQPCLNAILENAMGDSILDVGSGRGFLCKKLKERYPNSSITGTDIIIEDELQRSTDIKYIQSDIRKLPFEDNSFDTVVCSHVLEHIIYFSDALQELKRICRKRLIIVVPMEREYKNGFNLHLQFFPYPHSFTNRIPWNTSMSVCKDLQGDLYFHQDVDAID